MTTVSVPVDITPPVADDSLVEPKGRAHHEPLPASSVEFPETVLDATILPLQRNLLTTILGEAFLERTTA